MAAGAAVTVGLPRLGAMLNTNGTAYAAGAALPKRFGVWFWGNGMIPPRWIPKVAGVGTGWELSEQLMPFAKVKKNLTVLTGYQVKIQGSVHRVGPAGALSGSPHSTALNYTAPTIDHVISSLIGSTTPFRSLEVGVCRATANGEGQAVNYASSSGANSPVQPEYDASAVFTRLFGKAPAPSMTPAAPANSAASRKRILDAVADDVRSLRPRLGVDDGLRLDQHLEGINQLEKRLTTMVTMPMGMSCNLPANAASKYPPVLADNNGLVTPEQNNAMVELTTYALSCDLTRVALFQHGRPAAHYNMGVIGITQDIHDDISHQEAGDQPNFNRAVMYWMDQFRVFVEKLQDTPDGAGNLLENSLVYATSDVSFGKTHSVDEYPLLVFGRLGGLIKGDQHVRSAAKDNVSKLLFTLVNLYGGNVTSFGAGLGQVNSGVSEILV
jgi:hypothetical protein